MSLHATAAWFKGNELQSLDLLEERTSLLIEHDGGPAWSVNASGLKSTMQLDLSNISDDDSSASVFQSMLSELDEVPADALGSMEGVPLSTVVTHDCKSQRQDRVSEVDEEEPLSSLVKAIGAASEVSVELLPDSVSDPLELHADANTTVAETIDASVSLADETGDFRFSDSDFNLDELEPAVDDASSSASSQQTSFLDGTDAVDSVVEASPALPIHGVATSAPAGPQPVAVVVSQFAVPPVGPPPATFINPALPQALPPLAISIEAADNQLRNQLLALLGTSGLPAFRNVDVFVERGLVSIRAVVVSPAFAPATAAAAPFAPATAHNSTISVPSFPSIPPVAPWPIPPAPIWGAPGMWGPVPPPAWGPASGWAVPTPSVPQQAATAHDVDSTTQSAIPVNHPDPSAYANAESSTTSGAAGELSEPTPELIESEDSVRNRILNSLRATQIPALANLTIEIEGDSITLFGTVTSGYERQLVLDMVKRECDAWNVRNGIGIIEPQIAKYTYSDLAKDIWSNYKAETIVVASLLIALLGILVPWPHSAPASTYTVGVSAILDNQPMTGAVISLYPDNWTLPGDAIPTGRVGPDGKVVFTTFADRDGVPAGEYVVTARWNKLISTPNGDSVMGPNIVSDIFESPDTSPLKIKVNSGANELPNLVFSKK